MGSEWKPYLKYPWTALRDLGVSPAVQVGGEEYAHKLLATICGEIAVSGMPYPEACLPPKTRQTKTKPVLNATAPE